MNRPLVFKSDDSQDSAPELGDFGPEPKSVVFLGLQTEGVGQRLEYTIPSLGMAASIIKRPYSSEIGLTVRP